MNGPLIFAGLIALTVLYVFASIWRFLAPRDPVLRRLGGYGATGAAGSDTGHEQRRSSITRVGGLIYGLGLGPRLAEALARSNLSVTAAEFALIMLLLAGLGLVVGMLRVNFAFGVLLAAIAGLIPLVFLRIAQSRRQRAFNDQLPDILTLLVGALRAGYGINQSLNVIVDEMPDPAAEEFRRVIRVNALGVPMQQALQEMVDRVRSDDLTLAVTSIIIQYETGGNLAQILDTISETIRDRVRIMREVRVLTAQQRFAGYLLAAMPIFLAVVISILSPDYYKPFTEPGPARILPFIGAAMTVTGFVIMRRIVDIDV